MMKELSMHIIDIIQNSIKAEAKKIDIVVEENEEGDILAFSVTDNGCGMSEEMQKKIRDPFTTSRTTRKVGLGIPMLEQTCVMCGGGLDIKSEEGKGTFIRAYMKYKHIDRPPMGDMAEALFLLLITNLDIMFTYRHNYNANEYFIDTAEICEVLGGVPLNTPDVMDWLKDNINEGMNGLGKAI